MDCKKKHANLSACQKLFAPFCHFAWSHCNYQPGQDPSLLIGPDTNWNKASELPNIRWELARNCFMASCGFGTTARKWVSGLLRAPWLSWYSFHFFWNFLNVVTRRSLEPGSSVAFCKTSRRPGMLSKTSSSTKISLTESLREDNCWMPVGIDPRATARRISCSSQRNPPQSLQARAATLRLSNAKLFTTTRWPTFLRELKVQAAARKAETWPVQILKPFRLRVSAMVAASFETTKAQPASRPAFCSFGASLWFQRTGFETFTTFFCGADASASSKRSWRFFFRWSILWAVFSTFCHDAWSRGSSGISGSSFPNKDLLPAALEPSGSTTPSKRSRFASRLRRNSLQFHQGNRTCCKRPMKEI